MFALVVMKINVIKIFLFVSVTILVLLLKYWKRQNGYGYFATVVIKSHHTSLVVMLVALFSFSIMYFLSLSWKFMRSCTWLCENSTEPETIIMLFPLREMMLLGALMLLNTTSSSNNVVCDNVMKFVLKVRYVLSNICLMV